MPHHIERTIEPLLNISLPPCAGLCLLFKVYSTSVYMNLGEGGLGEGLQPSLSPIVQIYASLKSSFGAVFADLEAIADGLKPFAISHTARTISCKKMGNARGM